MSISEVDNLLNIKLVTPFDYRNKAMLELMYGTGLRVSELVKLKYSNIDFENSLVRVTGKGKNEMNYSYGRSVCLLFKNIFK